MNKYTIRMESSNPEFEIDGDIGTGVEADGFVLVCFKDEMPAFESIQGVSVHNLMEYLRLDTPLGNKLRQAAAIGEGYLKAKEIKGRYDKK